MNAECHFRVGLISMPWMAPSLPSIQLATLAATLQQEGIESETYEFFVDYAACIGVNVYNILSNAGGFIEEWIFAQHYFGAETDDRLEEFRAHLPRIGLQSLEMEERLLDALYPVTAAFLDDLVQRTDWSRYDIVGFSLTISQTAASMALARLLKLRHPEITIICGGAACAGPMGPALLRVCPYFDVVVGVEGELVLPELVRRLRRNEQLNNLAGVSWRRARDEIMTNEGSPVYKEHGNRWPLRYDAYFERLARLGLKNRIDVWLPFESSRGCWYGEKVQCTFCGLHEIMAFRSRRWESVLAELEDWAERYGVRKFFAVDLIMPRSYLTSFLPEVTRRGHAWSMFYEVKANMKRSEVEVLAAAGVRWIQPGIESLDAESLKLMRKGVTPLQNIQLLKWCEELNIRVTWNIIIGVPGENPSSYTSIAQSMWKLFHLTPPSGAAEFELHRFSPYFEHPEEFGIERLGAHPLYRYIFPAPLQILDDLVYRHSYRMCVDMPSAVDAELLREVIKEWKAARAREAELRVSRRPDGSVEVLDSRRLPCQTHVLSRSETVLYSFLDTATSERTLAAEFGVAHPGEAAEIVRQDGVEKVIRRWDCLGLVIREAGRVLALATGGSGLMQERQTSASELHAPLAYLGDIGNATGH